MPIAPFIETPSPRSQPAIPLVRLRGNPTLTFADNNPSRDTITRSAGSWFTDGFAVGHTIIVNGTSLDNDGVYEIAKLTTTVLTILVGSLTNETSIDITVTGPAERGSDTLVFDQHRQGVEITRDAYRYLGPMKISAGTSDHSLHASNFGQVDLLEPPTSFEESDEYTARLFLTSSAFVPRQPLSNLRGGFAELYDGVLEPLQIRDVVAHSTIDFPRPAHGVYAGIQDGNEDLFNRSERIVDIRSTLEPLVSVPFFDSADTFGSATLPGLVSDVAAVVHPFRDNLRRLPIETTPNSRYFTFFDDVEMFSLLAQMTGSNAIDSMLSHDAVSMTAGFAYSRASTKLVHSGADAEFAKSRPPYYTATDSVTFGGLLQ